MVRGGFFLFWAAIVAVLDNWRAGLAITAVPVLISAGAWALDEYFATLAYDRGEYYGGFGMLGIILDVWMVGFVAGGWHRFVLLKEVPQASFPKISFGLAARYAIYWFIIGIHISFILVAIFAATVVVFYVFGAFGDYLYWTSLTFAMTGDDLFDPFMFYIVGTVFVYFLFRIALGLPDMAVGVGRITILCSVRRTRPLRGEIGVLALLAGTAQVPFLNYYAFIGVSYFEASATIVALYGLISGILWGIRPVRRVNSDRPVQ